MKKLFLVAGLIVIAGIVTIVAARNLIARRSVEIGVTKMTGFPLTIEAVDVGLFDSHLTVDGLKLMNPADFETPMFVDLPRFNLVYQLGSFISGTPHLNEVTINLNKVVIIKNARGESNVQRLKGIAGGDSPPTADDKKHPFRIDVVHVHIGTVTSQDYSRGKLNERSMPLNVDVTYRNINDFSDITRLVLITILQQVKLPDVGIKVADLQKHLGPVQNVVGQAVQGVDAAAKGLLGKIKPAASGQ